MISVIADDKYNLVLRLKSHYFTREIVIPPPNLIYKEKKYWNSEQGTSATTSILEHASFSMLLGGLGVRRSRYSCLRRIVRRLEKRIIFVNVRVCTICMPRTPIPMIQVLNPDIAPSVTPRHPFLMLQSENSSATLESIAPY